VIRPIRILLADQDTKRRLSLLSSLRDGFAVDVLPHGSDPVRHARQARPDLVLLVVPRYKSAATLRCARMLKTATQSPYVALLDPGGRIESPAVALQACGADGYLVGEVGDRAAFVARVMAGAKPVEGTPPKRSLLTRIIG